MWNYEERGDFTWLFAGDDVVNMRQVRRFHLMRNSAAGDTVIIYYVDGKQDSFTGEAAKAIWKSLVKASEGVNIRAR